MLTPLISSTDPVTQAEGSIDPLGLAALADGLADTILPGLTARMWRPRFLTAIAVASVVTEPLQDQVAADGFTPAHIVFEWYAVEAFARSEKDGDAASRRIPGIDKARAAWRENVSMSARRYLKTPSIFGFHGVYKTLARALDITDFELLLGGSGYELTYTWEQEQNIGGFTGNGSGDGAFLRRQLQRAVSEGLRIGHTADNPRWRFFPRYLRPEQIGRDEGKLIWRLIVAPEGGTRGEVFHLMARPEVRAVFDGADEAEFVRWLSGRASEDLCWRLRAIDAYECVCRTLQDGFDWLRYLSSRAGTKAVTASDFARQASVLRIAQLPDALNRAQDALEGTGREYAFTHLIAAFDGARDVESLFHALLARHEGVQREKPPAGKRPWFERTSDGGAVVRLPYRLLERPDQSARYVHGYRMNNVTWFVDDLRGGAR
jgi:hypothetical protein